MSQASAVGVKPVPGPKILMVGSTGSGKTHAIRTLIDAGLKVFVQFTEPGMEVIADIPCEKGLHWHYTPPADVSWAELMDAADKMNKFSLKALSEMSDINKSKYRGFYDFLSSMSNLTCDRCAKSFGAADYLDDSWAIVNDSLSGISVMQMNLVVGGKPIASQADWGMAMKNLENYINKFAGGIQCMAIMMAHLERETDEVTGASINMASTLGKKLAPKIPRFFSDVIHARREGTVFSWSTATINTDLKARNLPIGENIPPTFVPIVKKWQEKIRVEKAAQVPKP